MVLVNKLFNTGFAFLFALSQVLFGMSSAYAQSNLVDVEPPLIEHTVISPVDADSRQSFFATVVDDDELDTVSLYYRLQDDPTYSTVLMQRVSFSSTYIVHIPADADSTRNIEYYIQARDLAGNRTVRGYAFNPLVREINTLSAEVESTSAQTSSSIFEPGKKRTVLYVVLGVLAAGVAVTLLDNESGESCPNGKCNVNITLVAPLN